MNRYITFLLVLLTATGSEAQAIGSALAVSKGSMAIEEILSPEQIRAIGPDIMSVLRSLQASSNVSDNHSFFNNNLFALPAVKVDNDRSHSFHMFRLRQKAIRSAFVGSSISIRAPSKGHHPTR